MAHLGYTFHLFHPFALCKQVPMQKTKAHWEWRCLWSWSILPGEESVAVPRSANTWLASGVCGGARWEAEESNSPLSRSSRTPSRSLLPRPPTEQQHLQWSRHQWRRTHTSWVRMRLRDLTCDFERVANRSKRPPPVQLLRSDKQNSDGQSSGVLRSALIPLPNPPETGKRCKHL